MPGIVEPKITISVEPTARTGPLDPEPEVQQGSDDDGRQGMDVVSTYPGIEAENPNDEGADTGNSQQVVKEEPDNQDHIEAGDGGLLDAVGAGEGPRIDPRSGVVEASVEPGSMAPGDEGQESGTGAADIDPAQPGQGDAEVLPQGQVHDAGSSQASGGQQGTELQTNDSNALDRSDIESQGDALAASMEDEHSDPQDTKAAAADDEGGSIFANRIVVIAIAAGGGILLLAVVAATVAFFMIKRR